jgi:hypothetical protein
MTTPTASEIKTRYPALASISDPAVDLAIADAVPWFDVSRWGSFYAQGFAAFVAHMLTADQAAAKSASGGAAGPVIEKKVGDVGIKYAPTAYRKDTDAQFATTIYGQRYLQLRRMVGMGAVAV